MPIIPPKTTPSTSSDRVKLKLSTGVTAKPSVSTVATSTDDTSLSLAALHQRHLKPPRSVGVNVVPEDLVRRVERSVQTQGPLPLGRKERGTSPRARPILVDASVQSDAAPSTTNYCDECKSRNVQGTTKPVAERTTTTTGQEIVGKKRPDGVAKSRIPVMSEGIKEKRAALIRQDTWTESLDQLGDG